jgi:hypothetical protein
LVSQKTGSSLEKARSAIETVVGYRKDKLPPPVAGQIEALLEGGQAAQSLEGIADSVGGLLNKK